jgi:excisionase family DNA binding protein
MYRANINNEKCWATREEIAQHFGFSVRTVANLQSRRVLPFVKVGRLVRFNLNKCEQALIKFETKSIFEL